MPVTSTHPDYDMMIAAWERARDVVAGSDRVKAGGEKYLPMVDGMEKSEYDAYRMRAVFFNATGRTHAGLVGAVMEEPVSITAPTGTAGDELRKILNDSDLAASSITAYGEKTLSEVLEVARGGTLVEFSEEEKRPYFCFYHAEKIKNWAVKRIDGVMRLTLLTLEECEVLDDDPFEPTEVPQLRVLRLVQNDAPEGYRVTAKDGWHYIVEIWQEKESKPSTREKKGARATKALEWVVVKTFVPTRLGVALPDIPFVIHAPVEARIDCCKLPLDDLIAVNLDHYRLDADYKHGLHFTALPTAWVAGFPVDSKLKIGSAVAWVSDKPDAHAEYLEFKGQGLKAFNDATSRDERIMTVLGARLLEEQKRDAEAAETVELRHKGSNSILAQIASAVSKTLTKAVHWLWWWQNANVAHPDDIDETIVNVKLSQEFAAKNLSPEDLVKLVDSWLKGGLSDVVYCSLLKDGGAYPAEHTVQDEMELLQAKKEEAREFEMELNAPPKEDKPPDK